MRRFAFLFLILALFASCDVLKTITEPDKKANVVMVEGPTFEDGSSGFLYKGRVQNQGDTTAGFTRVIIYIRNSSSALLKQAETNLVDVALEPNETSAWEVKFSDEDRTLRNSMDKAKLTYEIKWE
jgi:hypothetical protein